MILKSIIAIKQRCSLIYKITHDLPNTYMINGKT